LDKYGIYTFLPQLRQFIVISIISVTNTFVDLGLCSHHAWITTWSCPWLFSVVPSTKHKTGASYLMRCSGVHLMLQNSDDLAIIVSVQTEILEGKYLDHNCRLIIW